MDNSSRLTTYTSSEPIEKFRGYILHSKNSRGLLVGKESKDFVVLHISINCTGYIRGLALDPGKGVCVDPVGRDATLGAGGPGPPVGAGERQLSLDSGGEKT